jgi:hypothetical protein
MIHIIDFHPCLNMISPSTMTMKIAPRARKTPAKTVSAVGTTYEVSIVDRHGRGVGRVQGGCGEVVDLEFKLMKRIDHRLTPF